MTRPSQHHETLPSVVVVDTRLSSPRRSFHLMANPPGRHPGSLAVAALVEQVVGWSLLLFRRTLSSTLLPVAPAPR